MSLAEVPFNALALIVAQVAQLFGDQTLFIFLKKNTTPLFQKALLKIYLFSKNLLFIYLLYFGHLTFTTQMISLNRVFYIHMKNTIAFFKSKLNILLILDIFIQICIFVKFFFVLLLNFPLHSKVRNINNCLFFILMNLFPISSFSDQSENMVTIHTVGTYLPIIL